ncbi:MULTISPECIES: fused response regulator/phosphatase [unclassified Streptomyces]|uniref:fused response regulator/phosphatase n=1 Tax=unclassified Streptomyces TaxID=2593676 RepID=UPI0028C4914C|nr:MULTISPECIES: fused response regulator/phosphatase [unclassified Streptomyces]WNO74963.1 fused response regulator/phosphatase [Streptomyces sp. AM8-1-1]
MNEADGTTVLVVDDLEANRYAMGAVLRRAGHLVVPSACAGDALIELDARLRSGALPDAALVDVGLPDMSGFELCRRIKAHPEIAAIPVVHFSAAAVTPRDRTRGLDSGAEAYLTIPVEPEEIEAVVRAALRGARSLHDAEAQADRLNRLAAVTTELHCAHGPQELADLAAGAVGSLTGGPAAAFVFGVDETLHAGSPLRYGSLPGVEERAVVARLMERCTEGRTGVQPLVLPPPLWPPGFFRPEPPGGAALLLARSGPDQPPVCLAYPLGPRRDPHTTLLLRRLAHTTALTARTLRTAAEERHVALTLQRSFLPQQPPALPGAELALRYVPASRNAEIGGDFYVALATADGLLVGVGDVVGHSLDAATVMVELRHALRAYATDETDPAVLLHRLDRMLQRYHPEATATVCLALIDPATGRTRIANGGHIRPLIVDGTGGARYAEVSGPLLGLGLGRPRPAEVRLARSERLLMVTDGLIETRGTDLAVSMDRLRHAARQAPPGVEALCDSLLDRFGTREDDVALLALRMTGL